MKFLLFTFYFIFLTFYANSQIVFNNTYDTLGARTARNVIIQEDCYYTLGGNQIDNHLGIVTSKIGVFGDFIESKYFTDTMDCGHGRENSLRETKIGNYIVGGNRGISYYRDNLLIKLDENLDTIFTRLYYPVNDSGNMDVLIFNTNIDADGNYLMVGGTNIDNNYNIFPKYRMQLIKTDTLGNLLWRKTYGNNYYRYEGYKVVPAFGGGYILGGWTTKYGGDNCLIKTDENGENPIYRYFGHPAYGDGRVAGITTTRDSCYLITGYYAVNSDGDGIGKLIKLDRDLNIIWEKEYLRVSFASYFTKAFEKPNGNLIVHGNETNSQNRQMTVVMELTSQGDSLWKQTTTCHDTIKSNNYMESAKLTPDGGLVFGGWTTNINVTPYQQMALIKMDSTGCDGTEWTHCGAVDIVEPTLQSNTDKGLRVYPNPASATLNITLSELQMQTDFADVTDKKIITNHKNLCQKNNNLTIEQFKDLTIDKKLKYNSKHPKQNLWSKSDRAELLAFARKQAIMLPFDVLRGEVIFLPLNQHLPSNKK